MLLFSLISNPYAKAGLDEFDHIMNHFPPAPDTIVAIAESLLDGIKDDIEIQDAIDNTHGPAIIDLPEGTFNLEDSVKLKSNIWIVGKGADKTIVTINKANKPAFTISPPEGETYRNIRFSNLMIDTTNQPYSNQGGGGITYKADGSLEYLVFDGLNIKTEGGGQHGIVISGDDGFCRFVKVTNSDITIGGLFSYGVLILKPTEYIMIQDNSVRVVQHTWDAFNSLAIYGGSKYFRVIDNHVEGRGHTGIAISPGSYGEVSRNTVRGSFVSDEGCIEVERKKSHGIGGSHDILVEENIVSEGNWGIYTHNRNKDSEFDPYNVTIRSNTIRDCRIGIYLHAGRNITLRDNIFEDCDQDVVTGAGIVWLTPATLSKFSIE